MATGMAAVIEAPPIRRRPWGLLVQELADLKLDDTVRWRAGVTFTPWGCDGPNTASLQFCIDDDDSPFNADSDSGDCPIFEAFHVYATDSGSALDFDSTVLEGRVETRFGVQVSKGITEHLITGGDDTVSPTLASSATVLTAEDGVEADFVLSLLEQHLANTLHGGQGIVWVSPAGLAEIKEYLEREDGHWWTASGHLVVADAGHSDQPPDGETSDANEGWAYATGLVSWALGEPKFRNPSGPEALDRARNIIHARRIAEAVVAFVPCAVGAAKFRYSENTTEGS